MARSSADYELPAHYVHNSASTVVLTTADFSAIAAPSRTPVTNTTVTNRQVQPSAQIEQNVAHDTLLPTKKHFSTTTVESNDGQHSKNIHQLHFSQTCSYGIKVEPKDDQLFECFGCQSAITERFYLQVQQNQRWHTECLRCVSCLTSMESFQSCFIRNESPYCKNCYSRDFGTKCARCNRPIHAQDWVRRARDFVYHLACFACDNCKRQLSTGEEFALQDSRLLCKTHYTELIEGESQKTSQKQKAKRVRTTFTEDQLQVLQANFQIDSNPDGQDLERIAQITGLSKRVTQVWFQNSRARQKKYQSGSKRKRAGLNDSLDEGLCSPMNEDEEYSGSDITYIDLPMDDSMDISIGEIISSPSCVPSDLNIQPSTNGNGSSY